MKWKGLLVWCLGFGCGGGGEEARDVLPPFEELGPLCSPLEAHIDWISLDKPCPPDADRYQAHAIRPPLPGRTRDAVLSELAEQVPGGLGGIWYGEPVLDPEDERPLPGPLTLALVDPRQREPALGKLAELAEDVGFGHIVPDLPGAEVCQGRWDFLHLYQWHNYLRREAFAVDDLVSAGISESRNRIEYGVASEAGLEELAGRLRALDLPCHLVAAELEEPIVGAVH